jgi:hypothetical protein
LARRRAAADLVRGKELRQLACKQLVEIMIVSRWILHFMSGGARRRPFSGRRSQSAAYLHDPCNRSTQGGSLLTRQVVQLRFRTDMDLAHPNKPSVFFRRYGACNLVVGPRVPSVPLSRATGGDAIMRVSAL